MSWISWAAAVERRVISDHPVVCVIAADEPGQPDVVVVTGVGPDLVAERVPVLAIAGRTSLSITSRSRDRHAVRVGHARRLGGVEQRVLVDRLREPVRRSARRCRRSRRRPASGSATPSEDTVAQVAKVLSDPADLVDHRLGDIGVRDRELRHADREPGLLAEDRVDRELGEPGVEDVGVAPSVEGDHLAGDRVLGRQALGRDRVGAPGEVAPASISSSSPARLASSNRSALLVVAHEMAPRRPGGQEEVEVLLGKRVDLVGHGGPPLGACRHGVLERSYAGPRDAGPRSAAGPAILPPVTRDPHPRRVLAARPRARRGPRRARLGRGRPPPRRDRGGRLEDRRPRAPTSP